MAIKGILNTNSYRGRYYSVVWDASQSIQKNESIITWTLYAKGDSGWLAERDLIVTLAGTTVFSKGNRVERYPGYIASGTVRLAHDVQGNKSFGIGIRAAVYTSSINCTASGNYVLNKIPRQAVIQSAPNFTDEDNPTITYKNILGNGVTKLSACISFTGKTDDIKYRPISKTGSSYTFELTAEERLKLRQWSKNSNEKSVIFYIKTELNNVILYSTATRTMSIVNAKPTATVQIENTNSYYTQLTGNAQTIIKGFNDLKATFSTTVFKEATLVSQKLGNGNQAITSSPGTFKNVELSSFVLTGIDSRSNAVKKEINLKMVPYFKPTCNLVADDPNAEGEMKIHIKGECFNDTFGAVQNDIHVFYRVKTGDKNFTSWTELPLQFSQNSYIINSVVKGLDYTQKQTVEAKIVDSIVEIVSAPQVVRTMSLFDWSDKDFAFNIPVFIKDKDGVSKNLLDLFQELRDAVKEKFYVVKDFNFKKFWQVEDFMCCKKGNFITVGFSLHTTATMIKDYLYDINDKPIPQELTPTHGRVYLHGIGCDGTWHKPVPITAYIDESGFLYIDTPVIKDFYKISGTWAVKPII